jgi:hypothetical protein
METVRIFFMETTHKSRRVLRMLALSLALSTPGGAAIADDRVDLLLQRVEEQDRQIQELRQELQDLRSETVPQQQQAQEEVQQQQQEQVQDDAEEIEIAREEWGRQAEESEVPAAYDNPSIQVDLAGQINQAMNFAGDGADTKAYFVDNETSNTRLRLSGIGRFQEGWDLGTTLELAFSPNPSTQVSQDDETVGDNIQVRRAEIYVRNDRYGRVMFGQGSAAADDAADYDLSLVGGPIMYSGVADIMGGLQFTDGSDLTGVMLSDAFFNFDSGRMNRIRYDSPMLGPVQASVSAGSDQRWDVALSFGGDYGRWSGIDLGPFTGIGAVGFYDPNDPGMDHRFAGSWSMLHDDTGLSLTVSGGLDTGVSGDTPFNWYSKLGWDVALLPFGATGFGVDYTLTENFSANGDQGQSVGLAMVQLLDRYGIELYTQFRWFTLDRATGPSFDDIYGGTLGTRVRF